MLGRNGRSRPRFPARRAAAPCYIPGMSRRERKAPEAERIRELLAAGDHRAARGAARALRDDPSAGEGARAAAAETLASLAPERGAAIAGALGAAAAIALTLFVLLRG